VTLTSHVSPYPKTLHTPSFTPQSNPFLSLT
jgi:hypothetical protein